MGAKKNTSDPTLFNPDSLSKRLADLEASEQRYRATLYSISEGIITTDTECCVLQMNPVAESLTGWIEADALGQSIDRIYRIVDEQTHQPIQNPASQVLGRGVRVGMSNHALLIARDGAERAIMDSGAPIRNRLGAIIGAVLVFRDQTRERLNRRFIETRLSLIDYAAGHTLDQLLTQALDEVGQFVESPIGFYHFVDPDQKTLSLQQWSTRTLKEFCRAEDLGQHSNIDQAGVWVDCIHQKKPVIHNDYAALPHKKGMPQGHAKVLRELVVPVIREDKVVAILGVGNKPTAYTQQDVDIVSYLADVTWQIVRQKRADQALLAHQRTITLNNRIANAFLTASPDALYADVLAIVREALESRFGYFGYIDEAGDLVCPSITTELWDLFEEDDKGLVYPRSAWKGLWGTSLIEKRPILANESLDQAQGDAAMHNTLVVPIVMGDALIGQFGVANKPGGYSPEDQELLEKAAAQTAPVLKALRDEVSHRRKHQKLEQQYHQAQKLESIGQLAGGIAHDLNNLLTPIIGYGEILLEDTPDQSNSLKSLKEIVKAGMRAQDLVRQLLAFSRKQTLEFKPIALNPLLKNFKSLLRRTIREDVTIRFIPGDALPLIQGDVGQLEQVIMNLAVNAQDAMPAGGTLTIETAQTELDENYARKHQGVVPGSYVKLVVRDTGCGMAPHVRERLFEPFFTTKSKDNGTGLGLATVYGIIKQHRGNIWCKSSPEQGATFSVYLPVSTQAPAPQPSLSKTPYIEQGSETILLVEDDEQVRQIAKAILEQRGYQVLLAESGNQALSLLDQHTGPVHLLLTDVVMPEMNGKELHEHLMQKRPNLRTLYMSGYTGNVIAERGVMDADLNFLSKPFSVAELALKVREVLDQ